ncbi:MAG TPA: hypothetical protein VH661_03565 [Candidatus Dormibacteraeota bacterium]|nr:hypothetical protein [Candidatus Dormibacteraeota bacterium]
MAAFGLVACGGATAVSAPSSAAPATAATLMPTPPPLPATPIPVATAAPTRPPTPKPVPTMAPKPRPTAMPCVIPQHGGGDQDADNFGRPSDGDGCDR